MRLGEPGMDRVSTEIREGLSQDMHPDLFKK
jgi:hypothetical protein